MTEPIFVLDHYYLAITFLITLTIQCSAFLISYALQFDKITDFSGGANFAIIALVTFLFGQTFHARNWVVTFAALIWAIRLAGFLLFRVLKRGQDNRFDEMRREFWKFAGFWTFQLIWVWLVSWPIVILNSPAVSGAERSAGFMHERGIKKFGTASDVIGLIAWAVGLVVESVADLDKYRWKASQKSGKDGDLPVCRIGFWKWSRHPNYFGELLLWWGIWLMTIASAKNRGISSTTSRLIYGAVISPIFITVLLMFVSGLPTAERPVQQSIFLKSHQANQHAIEGGDPDPRKGPSQDSTSARNTGWEDFKTYLDQTSILIPIPNAIYGRLPSWLKHTVLLDWPIYRFNDLTEGEDLIKQHEESQDDVHHS